jgi:tetraacyldisaccharide 4'-kinase
MQQLIHRIWYQGHQAKWLLLPLSGLFWLLSSIRRGLFSCGLTKAQMLPVPVIVVGNIPTVIYLIELLRQHGYKPGVISRGYGVNIDGVIAVNIDAKASDVGDEPAMIVARTYVPMVVGANRIVAANKLLAEFNVDVIISDDGLQHYALGRDIEIALVDGERRYGNHCLLPAGPLREGFWRLSSVDFVINNGGPAQEGEVLMTLVPAPLCQVDSRRHDEFAQQHSVIAMAGIGNPQRFFSSISQLGYKIVQTVEFTDHQAFDEKQLSGLSVQHSLLMTEKDAVKCRDFAQSNWWYLPVNAKLNSEFDHALLSRLQQVAQTKKGLSNGI